VGLTVMPQGRGSSGWPLLSADMFADLPVAVAFVTGSDLVVQFANDRFHALVDRDDLAGQSLPATLPEVEAEHGFDLFRRVLQSGEPLRRHEPAAWAGHRRGWPERVFMDAFYQPVRDDSGAVTGVLFFSAEVTAQVRDRYRDEELAGELTAVKDRYRALFETLPFGVIRYSADGLILEANPAASQIIGLPPEDLLTWPLPAAAHAVREDGTPLAVGELPLEVALRTSEVVADQLIGMPDARTGGLRWLKVTAVPYWPDEAGQPRCGYVIFRDVTEQRHAEQERIATADRERAALAEAQIARERLGFLIRAGELVSVATDRDELLSRAAKLVVPGLADLCVTFRPGDEGMLRATSVAYRTPGGDVTVTDLRDYRIPRSGPLIVQAAWEAGRAVVKESTAESRARHSRFGSPLREIVSRLDPRHVIAVPLMADEQPLGVITLGRTADRPGFAETADIPVAEELGRQLAVGLANADRSAWDHAVAQALQHAVLPDSLPRIAGLDLAARYLPSTTGLDVGGDWYDVFGLDGGRVGLAVGDVVGHNVTAASVMGQVRNLLRGYAVDKGDPAAVLAATDAALARLLPDALATAVYAVLDPASGQLVYACAGHPPPVCVTRSGRVGYLDAGSGTMLGVGGGFTAGRRRIGPGSTVLFYTDGLIEDRHRDLGEGLTRLADVMRLGAGRTAEQTCAAAQTAMIGTAPRADDLCLLAVRLAGGTPG
jgi:PAS domain S-box-containing protein